MSYNKTAIAVQGVGKTFPVYERPHQRLLQAFPAPVRRIFGGSDIAAPREFHALKDISFTVSQGETVGIIGRNGAGKSTLLQIICGILTPSRGTVEVQGKVAALLELGAGFNPEFSGRDNVFLNAAILGLTREQIAARMVSIEAFADIGDFIDRPVKTYSSGMYVRLAFSVIAHVDADVLIVDEALSVGDVYFQQKCMRFLRKFQEKGGSILFVSHDISSVTGLCEKALYLSDARNGEYIYGEAEAVCRRYLGQMYADKSAEIAHGANSDAPVGQQARTNHFDTGHGIYPGHEARANLISVGPFRHETETFGDGGGQIVNAWFEDADGAVVTSATGGERANLVVEAIAHREVAFPAIGFMLKDRLGQYVIAESSDVFFQTSRPSMRAGQRVLMKFSFRMPVLITGEYALNLAFADGIGDDHVQLHWLHDALALTVVQSRLVHGICGLLDLEIEMKLCEAEMEACNVQAC